MTRLATSRPRMRCRRGTTATCSTRTWGWARSRGSGTSAARMGWCSARCPRSTTASTSSTRSSTTMCKAYRWGTGAPRSAPCTSVTSTVRAMSRTAAASPSAQSHARITASRTPLAAAAPPARAARTATGATARAAARTTTRSARTRGPSLLPRNAQIVPNISSVESAWAPRTAGGATPPRSALPRSRTSPSCAPLPLSPPPSGRHGRRKDPTVALRAAVPWTTVARLSKQSSSWLWAPPTSRPSATTAALAASIRGSAPARTDTLGPAASTSAPAGY
mmetsp:Transcript_1108/g.4489  ORF Transcript_1108/g.4489 Transcript_1108/m.4489 type:complete len:278 (-) Transcript_1108:4550-5383(-)